MAVPASYNENELIQIIEDYLHGQDLENIRYRLKTHSKPTGAVARYQAIASGQTPYHNALNKIFDDLSIGGSILHTMAHHAAISSGFFNCYVLNSQHQLIYINSNKTTQEITFIDDDRKAAFIKQITLLQQDRSFCHLTMNQIKQLITHNTREEHIPDTTNLLEIEHYKNRPNLYLALKSLSKQHTHLNALIDVINETKPEKNWLWDLLSVTGLAVITAGLIYFLKENIESVQLWLEQALIILNQWFSNALHVIGSTPLIGILSHGWPLFNAWCELLFSSTPTDGNRFISTILKTIEHALPIVGFILCYLAAGTMTPQALTLFITGAIFEVVHTLYTVLHSEYNRQFYPLPSPITGDYHSIVATLRADNQYEHGLSTFLIKFFANLLSTTLVVVWCVYPPTLAIALSCAAIGALVQQIKSWGLHYLNNHYAEKLQEDICTVREQLHMNTPENGLEQYQQMIHQLTQENQALQNKIIELQEQTQQRYTDGYEAGYQQGFNKKGVNKKVNGLLKPEKLSSQSMFFANQIKCKNSNTISSSTEVSTRVIKQLKRKADRAKVTVATRSTKTSINEENGQSHSFTR